MRDSKFAAEQWRGVQMDMCASSAAEVADTLGVMPNEVTVFCSAAAAAAGFRVKTELQCTVILVPPEIMAGPDHWAVQHNNRTIWLEGG